MRCTCLLPPCDAKDLVSAYDALQEWRDLYALASLLSASLALQTKPNQQGSAGASIQDAASIEEALRLLDLGIMVRFVTNSWMHAWHGLPKA